MRRWPMERLSLRSTMLHRDKMTFSCLLQVESGIVTLAELCKANELRRLCLYALQAERSVGTQYTVADDVTYLRGSG